MTTVVVGGTRGLGLEIAKHRASLGEKVVLTGRDAAGAEAAAAEVGAGARGIALDLAEPAGIATALAGVTDVQYLVLVAIDRDENTIREYDIEGASRLATIKLVGYTEVVHVLLPQMTGDSAIVLFGGRAKDRPYPGSTTVSMVNGAVVGMTNALALECAPIRVNALHPGIVGDSPHWDAKPAAVDAVVKRTPIGRTVSMADIVDGVDFLLRNRGVNAQQLCVDGGTMIT